MGGGTRAYGLAALVALGSLVGCGPSGAEGPGQGPPEADAGGLGGEDMGAPAPEMGAGEGSLDPEVRARYGVEIVGYEPGPGAGFGQQGLPGVVLGPPAGKGQGAGSLDVLSLGRGGQITLRLERAVVDGPGPDLIVFENPFWMGGDPAQVWAELGEVSVSEDGERWHAFPCDTKPQGAPPVWPGCAGWTPTESFDASTQIPLNAEQVGGDGFDLADLEIERARFVRVRDVSELGSSPSAGFDLDAVGVVHLEGEGHGR